MGQQVILFVIYVAGRFDKNCCGGEECFYSDLRGSFMGNIIIEIGSKMSSDEWTSRTFFTHN